MTRAQESIELPAKAMESIIQEYRERLNQALEIESGQLKEKAEEESNQIISNAREEADKIIAEAEKEARIQAERIIARAMKEADQIVLKSSEKFADAQRESATVASELRRVANVISDFEAKLQMLGETQEIEEDDSLQAIEEEVVPKASASEKTEVLITPAPEKRGSSVKDSDETRLFKGQLTVEVVPPFNQEQTGGIPERLARLSGVEIISTGGYAKANRRITTITIDLEQPMPLLKTLKALSSVKDVSEHKGNIVVTVK